MKTYKGWDQKGFTLTELLIANVVFAIVALSILSLLSTLISSASLAKQKAVALTLATNQMEYLKSLPYNSLAVSGGSIYSTTPLPASSTQTVNKLQYTVKTSINYSDDAYDGCASYPTQQLKETYCRNYPAPAGAPAVDTNPSDYKVVNVKVFSKGNTKLAEVDTQVGARVSETASTTGALFVSVLDDTGAPVVGANVRVRNTTITPNIDFSDDTDNNGIVIFYGLPPDTSGYDYVITGSKAGYSSLTTIAPSGLLQPYFASRQIFSQQSSFLTLELRPQGVDSLLIETVRTDQTPLANATVYVKGGYKKFNSATDKTYYYDTMSPSDTRPLSDASGFATLSNLVPGQYIFCGDDGSSNCRVGGTTYYLAAAVPYSGSDAFNPVNVPTYLESSPPATTFSYGGKNYLQKVRLYLTTDSGFPRINSLTPDSASLASGTLSSFAFQISGINISSSNVTFTQGSSTYTASCSGSSTLQSCTVNLTGAVAGQTYLTLTSGGRTLTIPAGGLIGGINVTP